MQFFCCVQIQAHFAKTGTQDGQKKWTADGELSKSVRGTVCDGRSKEHKTSPSDRDSNFREITLDDNVGTSITTGTMKNAKNLQYSIFPDIFK